MDHYGDTVNCHAEKKSCISPKEDSLENISRIEKNSNSHGNISQQQVAQKRGIL